jgi:hypothetical protein
MLRILFIFNCITQQKQKTVKDATIAQITTEIMPKCAHEQ